MTENRPFTKEEDLLDKAEKIWFACTPADWLEAFSQHPKIGERKFEKKIDATKAWAAHEQKGVESATREALQKLVNLNQEYERRFGYIFIVYATGKAAHEMLEQLENRLHNSPEVELKIAMEEQNKITKLRLKKLLS